MSMTGAGRFKTVKKCPRESESNSNQTKTTFGSNVADVTAFVDEAIPPPLSSSKTNPKNNENKTSEKMFVDVGWFGAVEAHRTQTDLPRSFPPSEQLQASLSDSFGV
eukprot:GABV01004064.1.p1 GENE.GABV01004064.1~~GABV01004064.1.p1  ORF type:complete len:107 (+),score=29.90 GABV01004064.1:149-469(+)